jgi:hypothetical protein
MKTMMELLIRLQQLRRCCERTNSNQQLTAGEKNTMRLFKHLVRDCLPANVLLQYDHLKAAEPELLECEEVFAMAVLADTWRDLPPAGRIKLQAHFTKRSGGQQADLSATGRRVQSGNLSARSRTLQVRSAGKSLPS